jgi:hypothetical protein
MSNPRVVQVILAFPTRGKGTDEDPFRTVTQVFTLDGQLIAEKDPTEEVKKDEKQTNPT